MRRKFCPHGCEFMQCRVAGCEHTDTRPDLERAFGKFPSSSFASELAKSDPEKYAALRAEALAKGMIGPNLRDLRQQFLERQQQE